MKFTIENYKPMGKDNPYPIVVLSDEYAYLQGFLNDTTMRAAETKWVLEGIELVLTGKSETEDRDGDFFGLTIGKVESEAYDIYAKDKYDTPGVKIPTLELKEILDTLLKARQEAKV